MKIQSPTSFKPAPFPGRLNFPGHSLSLIVKGTFDLVPGGLAIPSGEQIFPTGDEFYPDDAEKKGSPRYDSDFAYFKMRADLLLVGACHAPNGRPVVSCPATFRVGEKSKTIGVLGNRRWEKHWLTWKTTAPEPFIRMDLRYENSFGGAKFPVNPVGKGFTEVPDDADGKLWPLPNIEGPTNLIQGTRDRPTPAGFGPLGRMWKTRRAKLGTYKGTYKKTRWPWFPEDIDWTHFNAAPEDQQLESYLRGDERLVFENLHPKHACYESQMPGLRVRCFLNQLTGMDATEPRFNEVEMRLDTLWVDMEAEKLVLVWRGWASVSSEDYEEIKDWYFISEPLAQSPAPVEHYYQQFMAQKTGDNKPFEPEAPPAEPPKGPAAAPDPALAAARENEKAETKKKLEAQTSALNAQMDFDKLPPDIQQKTREAQAKTIEKITENDPAKSAQLEHAAQMEQLHGALGKLGIDPNNLPTLTDKARAEQARLMNELGLNSGDLQGDPMLAEMMTLMGAVLTKTAKDSENLEPMIAEVRKQKEKLGLKDEPVPKPEAPPVKRTLTRESIQAKIANHSSFTDADLRGIDLSGLDLKGADFSGANLSGVPLWKTNLQSANLTKANLNGADLSAADLTHANAAAADFSGAKLRGTILKEADLANVKMSKADLSKAILDGAILESADLSGANLAECSAIRTIFAHADLTSADFQKGVAVQADFTKANLSRANFQKANLTEAAVIGVTGHQLDLGGAILTKLRAGGGCDLTGAKLVEASGDGSMWKGANLTGTDFRYAKMKEAMFTAACLKQANFSAADMKFSRFNKANLAQAKCIRMNLFQGNLAKADLTQTDFSGANLYEAEFYNAVLDRTVTENANLGMTKLEPL